MFVCRIKIKRFQGGAVAATAKIIQRNWFVCECEDPPNNKGKRQPS